MKGCSSGSVDLDIGGGEVVDQRRHRASLHRKASKFQNNQINIDRFNYKRKQIYYLTMLKCLTKYVQIRLESSVSGSSFISGL